MQFSAKLDSRFVLRKTGAAAVVDFVPGAAAAAPAAAKPAKAAAANKGGKKGGKKADAAPAPAAAAPAPAPAVAEAPKSFVRRDRLVQIAQDMQSKWDASKLNETDAGSELEPKYMASFPYPYMNGRLHLGHAFTISKAEFAVRFQRLQGKRALFPFGFHCTGMPIQAAANKLKRELNPEDEPEVAKAAAGAAADSAPVTKAPGKFSSKKSKSVAKGAGATTATILKACGVEEADLPKFQVSRTARAFLPQPSAHHPISLLAGPSALVGVLSPDWKVGFASPGCSCGLASLVYYHRPQPLLRCLRALAVYTPEAEELRRFRQAPHSFLAFGRSGLC